MYHAFLNFLFLLLCEGLRDAVLAGLRTQQQLPKFTHKQPRVLSVQKSSQVDLHFLWTRELGDEGSGAGRKYHTINNLLTRAQ